MNTHTLKNPKELNRPATSPTVSSDETGKVSNDSTTEFLRLASDNPQPVTSDRPSEAMSASIRMASYRLAAVFGELHWVDGTGQAQLLDRWSVNDETV